MQGVHLLPLAALLLLLSYLPPLAASDSMMAWRHDPEWYNELPPHFIDAPQRYNEAQFNDAIASPALRSSSSRLRNLVTSLLATPLSSTQHDLRSNPFSLNRPLLVSSSYSESPEWFLVHDPEFFNENLLLPSIAHQLTPMQPIYENVGLPRAQLQRITPRCMLARRLLRPQTHTLIRDSSLAKMCYEWFVMRIQSWRTSTRSD